LLPKRPESSRKRPNIERCRDGMFVKHTKTHIRNEKARDLVKSEAVEADTLIELAKRITM